MKITIYELLGLIKDGKAPKKIKYDDLIWILREEFNDYFDEEDYLFFKGFDEHENAKDFLLEQVEILDEKDEFIDIEELDVEYDDDGRIDGVYMARPEVEERKKINNLIKNQKKIIERLSNERD